MHQALCLCWAQHTCLSPSRTWSHDTRQVTLHIDAPHSQHAAANYGALALGLTEAIPQSFHHKDAPAFSSGFLKEEAQRTS